MHLHQSGIIACNRPHALGERVAQTLDKLEQGQVGIGPAALRQPVTFISRQGTFEIGHIFRDAHRSEEHTSELQTLLRITYAVYCSKKIIESIMSRSHII